ncbi:DUF6381 family protein [Streptomyces sp. NBC_01260]|uniref:DUF6381 family protein n=1 Tax=Streptomyces laculatispora TaxID=887464 RepID=A0ABY9IC88_9ACTN|nr:MULTISPECIES: DUF6381 family protein [Streptomyces]MCX4773982.1 DUF6381 family protein [Streptomyces sp. NBC_01285]WLQ44289.1 DUF6381 family protein [Streptomyces laculatispora]
MSVAGEFPSRPQQMQEKVRQLNERAERAVSPEERRRLHEEARRLHEQFAQEADPADRPGRRPERERE